MKETKNILTIGGAPLTLLGEPIKVGDTAPDFTTYDVKMGEVHLSDFKGKTVIISVFPSIDTPVCATQTARFNREVTALGDDVVVLAVSKDLPFALGRFCAAEGIDRVVTTSDYRVSEFGGKYGFLIKENQLLGRGVVVVDKHGKVAHVEYVGELSAEPNYTAAIEAVKKVQ